MYFKVEKGTTLFDTLMAVHEQIKVSKRAIAAICKEVGSDGASESRSSYIAGDINAFHFDTCQPPSDAWMKKQGCFYMPKVGAKFMPQNKELLAKIKAIPKVKSKALMEPIAAEEQWYDGLTLFRCPGFEVFPEYILLSLPDKIKYMPIDGMIELLGSQYSELSKKEDALKYT